MREVVQIVELEQPRCALRFGVSPCTATGRPCYNTITTCGEKANFDGSGSIKWRFCKPELTPAQMAIGGHSDPDNIKTDAIPCLVSVSSASGKMNVGAIADGKSPFGIRSQVTVNLSDILWSDYIGDYYLADRASVQGHFWAKWAARNKFTAGMYLRIYEGYVGQSLADMQQRLYVLDQIDGPNASGSVTLRGLDPLRLADTNKAQFPRAIDAKCHVEIGADSDVLIRGDAADLTDAFGNSTLKYGRIGDEVISYTGATMQEAGVYLLAGATRGALDTVAAAHKEGDAFKRIGRYEKLESWKIARDLLLNHTTMDNDFIDIAAWDAEGDDWLNTFVFTGNILEPTGVGELVGELCQQSAFNVWWDERAQKIPMLAVRPSQDTPLVLDDRSHILEGSAQLKRDPSERKTRIFVYWGLRDTLRKLSEGESFNNLDGIIQADLESEDEGGEVLVKAIYSRWINTRAQAIQVAARVMARYLNVPRYLTISVDAKDRSISMGEIVDVETSNVVDAEGNIQRDRWQVISAEEVEPGHTYVLDLQTFDFSGRYGVWMDDDAPDYDDASDAEKLAGCWWADDDGEVGGEEGYRYQ